MKKIYQKPEVIVTKVLNTEIICLSDPTKGFNQKSAPTTGATSGNLTKDRGDYEMEDEVSFGDLW